MRHTYFPFDKQYYVNKVSIFISNLLQCLTECRATLVSFLFDIFNGGYVVIIDIKRNGFGVSFSGITFIPRVAKMCRPFHNLQ